MNLEEINNFCEYLLSECGLSKNTSNSYRYDLLDFYKYLENSPKISPVNKKNFEDYILTLKTSEKTINRKLATFKKFYDFLKSEKIIEKIPEFPDSLKITKKLPKFLSIEDIEKLIKTCDLFNNKFEEFRAQLIIYILYGSGLRVSELINLKFTDINFENFTAIIKGKGNKERIVPICENASDLIKKMHSQGGIDSYILSQSCNHQTPLSRQRVCQILNKISILSNISPLTPHLLRHSFATHLLNNGANLFLLQKLLGHKNVSTTEIYTHVGTNDLKITLNNHHPLSKTFV